MHQKRTQFFFWTKVPISLHLDPKHSMRTMKTIRAKPTFCLKSSKWACIKRRAAGILKLLLSMVNCNDIAALLVNSIISFDLKM